MRRRLAVPVLLAALAPLTVPAPAVAQVQSDPAPSDSLAWAGADGIYVWLGGTVVSGAHPVAGVVAHRVERRRAGESGWRHVADVQAVETADALFEPLDSVTRSLVPGALGQPDEAAAWRHILAFPTADSLAAIIGHPAIRRLLGIYAIDGDVADGDRWEYRIADVTAAGQATSPRVTTPVAYPSDVAFEPVRTLRVEEGDSLIDVWWHIEQGAHSARSLEVWRREGRSGAFELVDSLDFFIVVNDSVQARWRDTAVTPNRQLSYFAVPRDVFLNRGDPSDTVTAYSIPVRSLPLPDSIRAVGSAHGIRVSWRFPAPDRARSIRVYRSTSLDSGWVHVAELPTRDTAFTDPWMDAMRLVYYRLAVTGVRGEESPPTAAVFAHFADPHAPAPPSAVTVTPVAGGARIRWAPAGAAPLSGYRVYRTDAPVDTIRPGLPFEPASPLLPADATTFMDTTGLLPGRAYTWAVEAINASGVPSPLSSPVQLATPPAPPPTPTGLRGRADGDVIVVAWDDMTEVDLVVAGYAVHRRPAASPGADLELLTPEPIPAPHNAFRDTSAVPGMPYLYYVRSVDYLERESDHSAPVRLAVRRTAPLPPPAPRALPGEGGIAIRWDVVPEGTVRIYRYLRGQEPALIAEAAADAGRHVDPEAAPGRRYYYRLSLTVDGVESAMGPEVSARP